MSKLKYTPGRWIFKEGLILSSEGYRIATIDSAAPLRSVMSENGFLISASPELLEASAWAAKILIDGERTPRQELIMRAKVLVKLNNAIAKATRYEGYEETKI